MKTKLLLVLILFSLTGKAEFTNPDFWTRKWVSVTTTTPSTQGDYQAMLRAYNWRYKNREILQRSAQDYLAKIDERLAFYDDPELEDYLYQLVMQIHPNPFPRQHRVQLNVKVIKSSLPEIFSFANGSIIISTGMLSLTHTEDELLALLANEIAHIVLDHNVEAYSAIQTKASISAIIGTGMYIATTAKALDKGYDIVDADYLGSFFDVGSQLLSYGILSAMGVGYNRGRIKEADMVAQEWMIKNNKNPYAYPQILKRLFFYKAQHLGTDRSLDDHRFDLESRLRNIVNEKKFKLKEEQIDPFKIDPIYDTQISDCLKIYAKLLIANENYSEAIPFLDRSIKSNWCCGETYMLKAIAMRHTSNSETDNLEIINLLDKAQEYALIDLPWIWSEKGLIYLRLNEPLKARDALIQYDQYFGQEASQATFWARKMIKKLNRRMLQQ